MKDRRRDDMSDIDPQYTDLDHGAKIPNVTSNLWSMLIETRKDKNKLLDGQLPIFSFLEAA